MSRTKNYWSIYAKIKLVLRYLVVKVTLYLTNTRYLLKMTFQIKIFELFAYFERYRVTVFATVCYYMYREIKHTLCQIAINALCF